VNRIAVVAVALAVLVGSVPAAATLSGAQATPEERPAPGAAFAGVVDVQQAEVDNEVEQRALDRRFAAAGSNGSKARIVAEQQDQLSERLAGLEAEKARLERAHENGSIGESQYRAKLAGLAAQIRAVERRANQTADVAAGLPEPALREHGANVSQVRSIAQQANRAGGGEVAEAARAIAGEGVGNGLGPPNASQRGPPASVGPPDGNGSDAGTGPPDRNGSRPSGGAPGGNYSDDVSRNSGGNSPSDPRNGTGNGGDADTATGGGSDDRPANGSDPNGTEAGGAGAPDRVEDRANGNDEDDRSDESHDETAGNADGAAGNGDGSAENDDGSAGNDDDLVDTETATATP